MKLVVAKWGNSLAVRLPVECTRAAGLGEGDAVEVEVAATGEITLRPRPAFTKSVFLERMRRFRAGLPLTDSTVEAMRRTDRY